MIKVAHVMLSYLGQPETFIWQYIRAFKSFYPVVISKKKENLDQFPIPNGILYSTYGKQLSYQWIIDNYYRRILNRPLGYAEKIMRHEGVRAIHAHYGPLGCEYLPLMTSLQIPLLTSFYGFDLSVNNVIENYEKEYQDLFSRGTQFLVEGPCMKKKLNSIGCPNKKISIQRISINLADYKLKSYLYESNRPIRILFVGRFVEKKGLEYAFRALAAIKNDYTFEFRVIGGGELETKLRQKADDLGFTDKIKWMGIQRHKTVIQELHNCDFLLQPSVTAKNGDTEGGAPTIILEAQACGVPIITTYHCDIPYITIPNESALLSDEKDIGGLISSIQYLFHNPDLWKKMGIQGRKHIKKNHDIRTQIANLENIYLKFITENNR